MAYAQINYDKMHPHMSNQYGVYTKANSRNDIYGMSLPLVGSIKGNLYDQGPSELELLSGEYAITHAHTHNAPPSGGNEIPPNNNAGLLGGDVKEGFSAPSSGSKGTTPLEDVDDDVEYYSASSPTEKRVAPYVVFILLLLLIIAIEYWSSFFKKTLERFVFHEKKIEYWQYGIIALIITLVFLIVIYLSKTNMKIFEKQVGILS
jgi:hypothetical protein